MKALSYFLIYLKAFTKRTKLFTKRPQKLSNMTYNLPKWNTIPLEYTTIDAKFTFHLYVHHSYLFNVPSQDIEIQKLIFIKRQFYSICF